VSIIFSRYPLLRSPGRLLPSCSHLNPRFRAFPGSWSCRSQLDAARSGWLTDPDLPLRRHPHPVGVQHRRARRCERTAGSAVMVAAQQQLGGVRPVRRRRHDHDHGRACRAAAGTVSEADRPPVGTVARSAVAGRQADVFGGVPRHVRDHASSIGRTTWYRAGSLRLGAKDEWPGSRGRSGRPSSRTLASAFRRGGRVILAAWGPAPQRRARRATSGRRHS